MCTVLIADEHGLVRRGVEALVLSTLSRNCTVYFASNGREVLESVRSYKPDLLITDTKMPNTDALEMVKKALVINPELKVLVVTVSPEGIYASRYLRTGVLGFLGKDKPDPILSEAILTVSKGRRYLTRAQVEIFADSFLKESTANPFDGLSTREFEVAMLLLQGNGAMEIASILSIAASTASTYRGRVFGKLGVKNLIQLCRLADDYEISNKDIDK